MKNSNNLKAALEMGSALQNLLNCSGLHPDRLGPEARLAIDEAQAALEKHTGLKTARMKLDAEKRALRLQRVKDSHCPFCGCSDTDYDNLVVDYGQVSQEATCLGCEQEWFEVYTLSEIEEYKP